MKLYLFIHGKTSSLSQYELKTFFGSGVKVSAEEFSVIEVEREVDQKLQDLLGGTVKIVEVVDRDFVDIVEQGAKTQKIEFGFSQYGSGRRPMAEVLKSIKNGLKERGHNARFLNKGNENISSGLLNKSRLIEKGVDLVICRDSENEWFGKTVVFQDIDGYSKRDFDKPHRDPKVGMLPPKLAQMMINFAQPSATDYVYDPFCGLGTLPMEAMLMCYRALGSDLKGRMIGASEKNIEWLRKNFEIENHVTSKVWQGDARDNLKDMPSDFVVVTEGYLGPPQEKFPNVPGVIFELLHEIHSDFFKQMSEVLKRNKRLVICLPFFRSRKGDVSYPDALVSQYIESGFRLVNARGELMYFRKNQIVGREIMVFEKA